MLPGDHSFESMTAALLDLCRSAGQEILRYYLDRDTVDVTQKSDASPLTAADTAAHHILLAGLGNLAVDIPILSEESAEVAWGQRRHWSRYWLVDPLDGTREFLDGNDEFTINIALIDAGEPVYGMVYIPAQQLAYAGQPGVGAQRINAQETTAITTRKCDAQIARVLTSRRYRGGELEESIDRLGGVFSAVERVYRGSALKFCVLAEGEADLYPRFSPCSEWDTAAGHAVLLAAGGILVDTEFRPLRYNQGTSLLNPFFYAIADPKADWASWLKSD